MEITQHPGTDSLELRLIGRLDATWAEHVSDTIEGAVRGGSHRIVLNFAGVSYISSLGMAVLMKHYKRLKSVNGSLTISDPSASTLKVLNAARLTDFLIARHATAPPLKAPARAMLRGSADYQVYRQHVAAPLTCTAVGDAGKLTAAGFERTDVRQLSFPHGTFGLGLGAFGEGFDDCRE